MDKLLAILKGELSPGLYRLTTEVNIDELSSLCKEYNFQFFYINGNDITSKAEFFQASAKTLNFPDYFGNNWDAFSDFINDLSWLSADGYIFLYTQPDNFANSDPSEWSIALDIFQEAVESWRETETPLYVLLRTDSLVIDTLDVL
ncbi:barstar family protein [Allocoleopsis sp.]|uniref:barstar family protein n=1 Tax=Allocoleopsis sp. TaxID=3088169 RepID=UPI002FD7823F